MDARTLSLRDRNRIFLQAVIDIFGVARLKGWEEVKKAVSDDRIREVYKVVAALWPPDTDLASLLPEPGSSLRALYLGDVGPEQILRNVFRFSLYADEILVVDPFHNPWAMAEEYNPLVNPGQWRMDTLKLVFFMVALTPWIEAGLVTLVPDPGHFDCDLRRRTWELAKDRLEGWAPSPEDVEDFKPAATKDFERFVFSLPRHEIARKLREFSPRLGEREIGAVLDHIAASRRQDPLDPGRPVEELGSQMVATRTGANLEMALYIAHATGAFPYTSTRLRWRELISVAKDLPDAARTWSPLTRAFQGLQFKFLDQVDSNFACSIRRDGRLESLRAYLRRLWSELGGAPDDARAGSLAAAFRDELTAEHNRAEAEWRQIDRDLLKQFGATASGALIAGGLSPHISAVGFAAAGVFELVNARLRRGEFRKRVPLSVFVDLSGRVR